MASLSKTDVTQAKDAGSNKMYMSNNISDIKICLPTFQE